MTADVAQRESSSIKRYVSAFSNIYRLGINIHFDIYIIYIIDYFSKGYFDTD